MSNEVRARGRPPPPNKDTIVTCIDICIYIIYIKEDNSCHGQYDDYDNRKEGS